MESHDKQFILRTRKDGRWVTDGYFIPSGQQFYYQPFDPYTQENFKDKDDLIRYIKSEFSFSDESDTIDNNIITIYNKDKLNETITE
ncbi:hypothetical protein DA469_21780 [Bacillus subtilis]|nr:hypothetical protein DA469_21780 [Bacillus subtilis]